MRRLLVAAAALSLLLAAGPPAARADDTGEKQPSSIQWIDGWSAGRDAAKKSGKLMLVYVHRVTPT